MRHFITLAALMLLAQTSHADEGGRFTAFLEKLGVSQEQMTAIQAVHSQ